MSDFTRNRFYGHNLPPPDVRILQYNYFHNIGFWNYSNCNSPFWYLWWNEQPGGVLLFNGREIELTPDKIVMLPPHTPFSTRCGMERFHQFYIHFLAGPPFLHLKRQPIEFPSDAGENFVKELNRWYENPALLSLKLYNIVFRMLLEIPANCFQQQENSRLDNRIERAVELLNENLQTSPGNEEICRKIKMSVNNFIRLFKKEMGVSPQQYLLTRRIEKSRNLLIHTQLSLEEIAEHTGFSDRYHFSKTFRKICLFTPAAYRKSIKNNLLR